MLIDVLLIIVLILTLLVVISMIAHIWIRVPYVPTPQYVVDAMVQAAGLKKGDHVYDIGAGDGRMLRTAARSCPGITAIGYEFVPSVCLYARLVNWWTKLPVQMRMRNAFHYSFADADVLLLYLFPEVMQKLEKKFTKELKPGTRIVSHAFPFADRKPSQTILLKDGKRERKILVYEW